MPSAAFRGAREGYKFQVGALGVGYYLEDAIPPELSLAEVRDEARERAREAAKRERARQNTDSNERLRLASLSRAMTLEGASPYSTPETRQRHLAIERRWKGPSADATIPSVQRHLGHTTYTYGRASDFYCTTNDEPKSLHATVPSAAGSRFWPAAFTGQRDGSYLPPRPASVGHQPRRSTTAASPRTPPPVKLAAANAPERQRTPPDLMPCLSPSELQPPFIHAAPLLSRGVVFPWGSFAAI